MCVYFHRENDDLSYHYEILFHDDDRYWGYCQCNATDELYNPKFNCCGYGCDWSAPAIRIEKIEHIVDFSFKGHERDMWELKEKWNGTTKEAKEREIQKSVGYLNAQIEDLLSRKEMLLKEIKQ